MTSEEIFKNNITIPFLLKKQKQGFNDGNALADIEEIDEEYETPPLSVMDLVIDGLIELDMLVRSRTKDWYGHRHEELKDSPIYRHTLLLNDYVLEAKFAVSPEEMDIEDHAEVLDNLKPYQESQLPSAPDRLEIAVRTVYEYWLFAERQLGLTDSMRSMGVRTFSVFAATAFTRFRLDFGHWGDFHQDIESELIPHGNNTEAVFTYSDIGLLLGVRKDSGDLGRSITKFLKRFRAKSGFRNKLDPNSDNGRNKNQTDDKKKIKLRVFNTEFRGLSQKTPGKPIVYRYTESEEYFQIYVNKGEREKYLTHSEAVSFLKNERPTKFKFTEFFYRDDVV